MYEIREGRLLNPQQEQVFALLHIPNLAVFGWAVWAENLAAWVVDFLERKRDAFNGQRAADECGFC